MRLLLREELEMLEYSIKEPPDEGERVRTEGRVESRFVALPERFFICICV